MNAAWIKIEDGPAETQQCKIPTKATVIDLKQWVEDLSGYNTQLLKAKKELEEGCKVQKAQIMALEANLGVSLSCFISHNCWFKLYQR